MEAAQSESSGAKWDKVEEGGRAGMMMGEYAHSLDDKGRITIPARFREDLSDRFVITKGLDGCLFLYPMGEWSKLSEKLKALPMTNRGARAFTRLFLAGAQEAEMDKQSRVHISPRLREYAGMEKDVILVGVSNRAELWAAARWEAYQGETAEDYEKLAEEMVELGF